MCPSRNPVLKCFVESKKDCLEKVLQELLRSFDDKTRFARCFYESGEAAKVLSQKSLKALETVLEEDDDEEKKRNVVDENFAIESDAKRRRTSPSIVPALEPQLETKGLKGSDAQEMEGTSDVVEKKNIDEISKTLFE